MTEMTTPAALVEQVRARLADGEQIDWQAATPEEQAALQVLLNETRTAGGFDPLAPVTIEP